MYYKHSGRFSLGGLVVGAITGAAGALLLAYVYAHGLVLISEAHFAAFATLAFGGLIGVATGYGLVWGNVRNNTVALALTGVISALALYVSWAMWIPVVLESQHVRVMHWIDLAQHPKALWRLIGLINQYGTWGLGNASATTGLELWGIWIAEAAAVIGMAMVAGIGVLNHHAFCETCGDWCRRGAKILLAPPQNVAQLKLQLEANDLRPLESLGPANKGSDHLAVMLDSCEQCHQFHTMSLTHTTIRRSKLGKPTINNKKIVKHLQVDMGQAEVVRRLSQTISQTAASIPKASAAASGKR